jgi:hypothetical protein
MIIRQAVITACFAVALLVAFAFTAVGQPIAASQSPSARAFAEWHDSGTWTLKAKRALARALWGEAGILSEYVPVRLRNGRFSKHRIRMCSDKSKSNGTCKPNLDWQVIPWVLLRRWESSHTDPSKRIAFHTLIQRYSAPLKPHLASKAYEAKIHKRRDMPEALQIQRRRFLQSLRYDGSNLTAAYRRLRGHAPPKAVHVGWEAIRAVVEAWGAGNVADICPHAQHWDMQGADVSRRLKATCRGTRNVFYAFRKKVDA